VTAALASPSFKVRALETETTCRNKTLDPLQKKRDPWQQNSKPLTDGLLSLGVALTPAEIEVVEFGD